MVNKDLPPGYYTVQWDGKNKDDKFVTNNLYIYTMQADTFSSEKVMCLQMLDPEHIRGLNAVPLVKTNSDGKFLLKYSLMPLGQSFRHTDEVGENLGTISVSQNIKVVLIKDGYKSFVEEMKVDGNSPINKTFRLTPN